MKRMVKDFIRTRPALYDVLKSLKRRFGNQPDPTYDWFDQFSRSQPSVRFVQIGAADGLRNDPIREFVLRDGWQGVLIEPLPDVFELLKRNYGPRRGLTFLNAAISDTDGSLSFWTFQEAFLKALPTEQRLNYLQKASFDKNHVRKFLAGASEDVLKELHVPCRTLTSILQEHMPQGFDLLVIDAEGHEPRIIHSVTTFTLKPKAIFFESHNIPRGEMTALTGILESAGYRVEQIEGDSVAVL